MIRVEEPCSNLLVNAIQISHLQAYGLVTADVNNLTSYLSVSQQKYLRIGNYLSERLEFWSQTMRGDMMRFGEALSVARDQRGMCAKDVCDISGVNAPYISRLLSGKVTDPTWTKACAIISALDMTPDEFRQLMDTSLD